VRLRDLLLAALAVAIVPVGCSAFDEGSEAVIPESTLPSLVLQPEDLSASFVRFDEGPLAIADSPVGERADPSRFGRLAGWKARYRRQGGSQTPGPLVVESRVDLFEGSGAKRELDIHRDELELQARHPSELQLVEPRALGDEAVALTPTRGGAAGSIVSATVLWRSANAVASLTVNGFGGRLELQHAVELARQQQRRIEAALPREG
jgi:hypothetical protein